MPEDFFAQGFDEPAIVFTKQQNQFFQSKLPFLDPRKSYQIPIGNVISLLKFSRLQPQVIMKIIKNCCSQSSKTVTYEQMKKIFRGIALKQNKIQPSKINIQANIKTALPVFYDDDSDEQQQQKPKPTKTITQKPPAPVNQPPPQKVQQPRQQHFAQQQLDPLKMWDQYWKNLKTKNHLIDGTEVKKLCTNNNINKNNLSKAWKLCNISQKGYLTKGQCFVFMNLINAPSIPDTLNKEMLDMIKRIQQACGYKKQPSNTTTQRTPSSSANTTKPKQMSASDVFGKFGQQSLFEKKTSAKVQEPIRSSIQLNNALNLVSGGSNIRSSSIGQKAQQLAKQGKFLQNNISKVATDNQTLCNTLQSLQKNFSTIQRNFVQTDNKITQLKQSQKILNDRLNSVCFSMKRIIQKQSQCISTLMQNIHEQNQINVQRIKVLESYTNEMSRIVDTNLDNVKGQLIAGKQQQDMMFQQVQHKNQALRQRLAGYSGGAQNQISSRVRETVSFKQAQRLQKISSTPQNRKSDPFADDQHQRQNHYEYNAVNQRASQPIRQIQPVRIPAQQHQQQPSNQKSQQNIDIQHLTPQQKMKIKQMQLIQLVNYITPIKQQEYAGVVERITSMSEQQMSKLYKNLYDMYLKKQQQKVNEQKKDFPNTDQFNTSQFINQDTLKNYKNQQYFKK